jgi:Flp pilus assembly protein TadG
MTNPTRSMRWRRGAQMLEFAMLLPIFVLLIVFTFDMGRLVLTTVALQDAVQTAARAGAQVGGADIGGLRSSERAFQETVAAAPALDPAKVLSTSTPNGARCTIAGSSRFVAYSAEYDFSFLTPGLYQLVSAAMPGDFSIAATGVSRCEVVR